VKRPLDVVAVVGLWDGSKLAREVGVVRGDADGGGGAVLRGAGEVGGVEREGVGGVRRLGGGLDNLGELELEGEVEVGGGSHD
jgi:hypothetical protein